MKINDKSPIRDVTTAVVRSRKELGEELQSVDRVTLSAEKAPGATISAARHAASTSRQERIQELITAVREGRYQPNAQQVANKILQAAELEAELRAMFSR